MPNYDNLFSKAQGLLRSGDKKNALVSFSRCAKSKPYRLRCLRIMGGLYGELSDYSQALSCFKQAVKLAPKDTELLYYLAMSMVFIDKDQSEILAVFNRALKVDPQYSLALYGAGNLYRDIGDYNNAKDYLLKAIEANEHHLDARLSLATIYRDEGDYEIALAEFDNCISLKFSSVEAHAAKSLTLFCKGEVSLAEEGIVSLAAKYPSNKVIASAYSEICKQGVHANDALQYIKDTIEQPIFTPTEERDLHKAAAKLSDLLGDYDEAFKHARLANDYIRKRFDSVSYQTQLLHSINQSTVSVDAIDDSSLDKNVIPIFILGMPRSGSSLVEKVLSCHPQIHAGGEITNLYQYTQKSLEENNVTDISQLNDSVLKEISTQYMAELNVIAGDKKYVTDKLPGNYEKIAWINALFPHAKIINTNRNKLDVCISCYFQNFGTRHPYVCDMNTLISSYRYYEEILSFWRGNSEIKIYDASYEQLITDTRLEIENMLEYLGVPWAEACMEHHKSSHVVKTASFDQVRQPLYDRSIGRWKNYEKYIPELLEAFGHG